MIKPDFPIKFPYETPTRQLRRWLWCYALMAVGSYLLARGNTSELELAFLIFNPAEATAIYHGISLLGVGLLIFTLIEYRQRRAHGIRNFLVLDIDHLIFPAKPSARRINFDQISKIIFHETKAGQELQLQGEFGDVTIRPTRLHSPQDYELISEYVLRSVSKEVMYRAEHKLLQTP